MVTKEQALTCGEFDYGECTQTIGPRGRFDARLEVWRRNGATKTWKTRPDDWSVPVKYGLKNHGYITPQNAADFHVPAHCPLAAPEKVRERETAQRLSALGEVIARVIRGLKPAQRKALQALTMAQRLEIAESPFPEARAVVFIAESTTAPESTIAERSVE